MTEKKSTKKPYDKGVKPQYIDRRYDCVSHQWHWRVPSWTDPNADPYTVSYNHENRRWECTCGHNVHREIDCKHIEQVQEVIAEVRARAAIARAKRELARSAPIASVPTVSQISAHGSLHSQPFSMTS